MSCVVESHKASEVVESFGGTFSGGVADLDPRKVVSLNCSSCGAPLNPKKLGRGIGVTTCESCGSTLQIVPG